MNDERFHALIARFRRRPGIEVLLRDDPTFLRAVRGALARNRIVALLIDQDTRGAGVFVPFFGRPAHTPPGAAVLGAAHAAPVVTVFIERRPEGGHRITIRRDPAGREGRGRARIVALTARFTAAIEAQIRRAPAEWVWWHERWRRQPDDATARARDRAPVDTRAAAYSPRGSSAPSTRRTPMRRTRLRAALLVVVAVAARRASATRSGAASSARAATRCASSGVDFLPAGRAAHPELPPREGGERAARCGRSRREDAQYFERQDADRGARAAR